MPGAVLDIEAPGTTLRMASTAAGFTSIVGWRGAVSMAGAADKPLTITSWDPGAGGPDRVPRDGRAYIRDVGAAFTLRFVRAGALGFWSGRTGGIALTGLQESAATGAISDTEISDNHYGLFTSDVDGLTVTATTFRRSELAGVLLHRGTAKVVVERSTAEANGARRVRRRPRLRGDHPAAGLRGRQRGRRRPLQRRPDRRGRRARGREQRPVPGLPAGELRRARQPRRRRAGDGHRAAGDRGQPGHRPQRRHRRHRSVAGRPDHRQHRPRRPLGGHRGAGRPVRRGGHGQPHRRWRDRPPGPGRPGRPAGQRRHRRHEPRRLGRRRGGRLDRRGELPRGRGSGRSRRRPGDAARGRHRRSERRQTGGTSRSRCPSTCRTRSGTTRCCRCGRSCCSRPSRWCSCAAALAAVPTSRGAAWSSRPRRTTQRPDASGARDAAPIPGPRSPPGRPPAARREGLGVR